MSRVSAYVILLMAGACTEHGSRPADANMPGESSATAALAVSPQMADFGTTPVGTTTSSQTFTVTNVGDATSGAITVALSGSTPPDFIVAATTCGAPLAPGASCTAGVVFAPTTTGAKAAELTASEGTATITAHMTGTTASAHWSLTGSPHSFGMVPVGTTNAFTFTLRGSSMPSGVISVNVGGTNAADFTPSGTCAGTALAPNATCTLTVAFTPSATGARSASVVLMANPGSTVSASVSGTGVAPTASLTVTPTPWDFGSVRIGDSSFGKMFTVNHPGSGTVGPLALSITGTHIGDFVKMADNCTGQTLTAGASCSVFVAFEPGAIGTRSGRLTIAASPGATIEAELSGTCTAQ